MPHTGSDQDNASASDFLLGQTDNGKGSTSAPDLLVSREAVDNNGLPEKLNIIDRKIIKDLSELHDKTINLNETFLYSVNKGNNKITELRTILQRESQNSSVYKQTKSVNNRKTVKTVMTLNDSHTEEAGRSLLHSREQRREEEDRHISMSLWNRVQIVQYMYICFYSCICILLVLGFFYMFSVFLFNNELIQ